MKRAAFALALARPLVFGAAFAAPIAAPAPALAADPLVSVSLSANKVEVDQPFTIELRITSDQNGAATRPELSIPSGMSARGPTIGSRSFMQSGPGGVVVERAATATWTVTASKLGRFSLQPSITFGGKTWSRVATVEVVKAGTLLQPFGQLRSPFAPGFGPFGAPPLDDDDFIKPFQSPVDPALALPAAPAEGVFLRIVTDKKEAVVGEQLAITIYQYTSESVTAVERHEPPLADFVRVPLKGASPDRQAGAMIAGKRWDVQVLDRVAVFPLRTGELHTGKMSMRYSGRTIGGRVLRESNDVIVKVAEPPKDGRPPGYRIGDVGDFALKATVAPDEVPQNGAISVTVRVTGGGNFPQSLRLPEKTGVEWADPHAKDTQDKGGPVLARTFAYMVRVRDAGTMDLGAVSLSFWDPAEKKYREAKADLGKVTVLPVAAPAAGPAPAAAPPDETAVLSLSRLGNARTELGAPAAVAPRLPLGRRFVWGLAGGPLLVVLGLVGIRLGRGARKRMDANRAEPRALAEKALAEAKRAAKSGSRDEAFAAIDRAVRFAVDARTGLRARGMVRAELESALRAAELPEALVGDVLELLREAEEARYTPEGGDEARELVARGGRVMKELLAA